MFVKVEIFGIASKSEKGFEKGDMHVVIIIESTTVVSLTFTFQLELIPMFFHMDSIRKSKVLVRVGGLLPLLSSSLVEGE
jgi:Na+/proline symporter